jgi:hypothetical protein
MSQTSDPRSDFGFSRTTCGCEYCKVYCRHMPGSLAVPDLERLCPVGQDVFAWAEQHLRALTDKPYPTLVPARLENGQCHWFFAEQCAVHAAAPYSCAFFDAHMSDEEARKRSEASIQSRRADAAGNGVYYRVWLHLRARGLTAPSGDREGVRLDMSRVHRNTVRNQRRTRGEP